MPDISQEEQRANSLRRQFCVLTRQSTGHGLLPRIRAVEADHYDFRRKRSYYQGDCEIIPFPRSRGSSGDTKARFTVITGGRLPQ